MSDSPSDEVSPRYIECLADWDRAVSPQRQEVYARSELDRLRAAGETQLLYVALTRPFIEQRNVLTKILREQGYVPRLRLRPGAVPPELDPQSRPLPLAERGKVLVAKVGTRGAIQPGGDRISDDEAKRYSARRDAIVRSPEGLYRTVRVTHEPRTYSLDDAVAVLMQWGVGIREKRYRQHHRVRYEKGALPGELIAHPVPPRDQWLVEEASDEITTPRNPAPTKRAA